MRAGEGEGQWRDPAAEGGGGSRCLLIRSLGPALQDRWPWGRRRHTPPHAGLRAFLPRHSLSTTLLRGHLPALGWEQGGSSGKEEQWQEGFLPVPHPTWQAMSNNSPGDLRHGGGFQNLKPGKRRK